MADSKLTPKEIEELRRLINLLEKDIKGVDFDNLIKSGPAAKALLQSLRKESEEFTADISDAAIAFKNVVGEIRKTNIGLNEAGKSFNKLSSIADKVQYHQKEISNLSSKEVEKLKQQAQQEKIKLDNALDLLKIQEKTSDSRLESIKREIKSLEDKDLKDTTSADIKKLDKLYSLQKKISDDLKLNRNTQEEISGTLEGQNFSYNTLVSTLDRINNELEANNKLLGLGGAAVEGLSTALNSLGFGDLASKLGIDEAKEKMEELAKEIRLAGGDVDSFSNKWKVLRAGISSMAKSVIENLKDPLVVSSFVVSNIIDAFKSLDKGIGELASNFGISYRQAAGVSSELNDAANASYLLNVTTQGLTEAYIELNNQFGLYAQISNEALESFTRLTKEAKLSGEAAKELFASSILTGDSVEDTTKEFLGQTAALSANSGILLNQKQLLESVKNISKATLLTLGGNADRIAEAVVKTKLLGVELQKVEAMSESLLDFESSIANELSAELITGKDLNLERARLAALNGDIATVAEEIAKQTGSAADFSKMNVIQQEALAKAVGMTREDLAGSLMEREAMVKLSGQEGENAKEKFNNLVKEVGLEEAKRRLGDDNLANMMAGQNIQERFAAATEKLKEVFVSLAEPLIPVLDMFANIFKIVGPIAGIIGTVLKYTIQWGKYLLIPYGIIKGMQVVTKGMTTLNTLLIQQNATKLAQNEAQATVEATKLGLGQRILVTLGLQDAVLAYQMAKQEGMTTFAAIREGLEQTILGKLIMQGFNLGKNLIKYIGLTVQAGYRALFENTIVGAILKQGAGIIKNIALGAVKLVQSMAIAAAELMGVSAATLGIGTAVAVAAAIAGYAALKSMKDGIIDPKKGPIVSGGFGSVQLSDKDTAVFNGERIIAGTNLGGKGRSNSTPQQDLSPLLNEMRALRQEQAKANAKPTVVENSMNGTKFGTSVAMNTYKIQ